MYLVTAQLEGASAADAAAHTRQIVFDRLISERPMFAGDTVRYKEQYDELKKRLETRAGARHTDTILSAMQRLGMLTVPANGNGGGAA